MSKNSSKPIPFPAILQGKPASLKNKPTRRHRWAAVKNEHRLMCQRLAKGTREQQAMAERSSQCRRWKPCGEMSRDALASLAQGDLICEPRGKSYDRTVARCVVGDKDIALEMVKAGHATVYDQYIKKRDPLRAMYLDAEATARKENVGIWASEMIPSDQWRRNRARLECER